MIRAVTLRAHHGYGWKTIGIGYGTLGLPLAFVLRDPDWGTPEPELQPAVLHVDGDGFGSAIDFQESCSVPAGYVVDSSDCDDADFDRNPGAPEICDGIDNNCDTIIDDGVWWNTAWTYRQTFTVTGGGWGHGVGMSQYGARGRADAGQSNPARARRGAFHPG